MMLVQPADESEQYHVASQAGRRQHFWLCLSTIKYGPSTSGEKNEKSLLADSRLAGFSFNKDLQLDLASRQTVIKCSEGYTVTERRRRAASPSPAIDNAKIEDGSGMAETTVKLTVPSEAAVKA